MRIATEPAEWSDETRRAMQDAIAKGWTTREMALLFAVDEPTVDRWRELLTADNRDKVAPRAAPDFIASSEAFFEALERDAMKALEAGGEKMSPNQRALLHKRALEARQARIDLRVSARKIAGSAPEKGIDELTDAEVDAEMKALDSKLARLNPNKRRTEVPEAYRDKKRA